MLAAPDRSLGDQPLHATSASHFQNYVLFTNYQFYIDEFVRFAHDQAQRPDGWVVCTQGCGRRGTSAAGADRRVQCIVRSRPCPLFGTGALEAQCAAIADDIAYNAHDLDDGLRAGLFGLDDLTQLPLAGDLLRKVRALYPSLDGARTTHEIVRRQITAMVEDVIGETQTRLAAAKVACEDDIRNACHAMVCFSPGMAENAPQ